MEFPSNLNPDGTPELDLYTIPESSSWFSWDSIHETERSALREFFDGSSYSRSPKIYKEYRDFIISKFREDPSRPLSFSHLRKSLVADVSLLRKLFLFLDRWGLINFNCPVQNHLSDEDDPRLRVEDGPPLGVKVVCAPNSLKPMPVPPPPSTASARTPASALSDGNNAAFLFPPLPSYSDVFAAFNKPHDAGADAGVLCGNCNDPCASKYYLCAEDNCVVCMKCFEKGVYGESKTAEDFRLTECVEKVVDQGAEWTEAEILLLLETVLKHGDDWDVVAQSVGTKTKSECISRLIEMPFGELMLGSHPRVSSKGTLLTNTADKVKPAKVEPQETLRMDDSCQEPTIHKENGEQNGKVEDQSPLPKKRRIDSSDPDRPLMKQVALISEMVGPKVKAAAVGGSVSALCSGNHLLEQIFYPENVGSADGMLSGNLNMELDKLSHSMDLEIPHNLDSCGGDDTTPQKDAIPLPLRMRAAVATALGTAAARARLMASQEEREMEFLISSIIETQLKKLQSKFKHIEELEHIMHAEQAELQELKECIVSERMDLLKKIVSAGISR